MRGNATPDQQRPSTNDMVSSADLHRLLVGLRAVVDGPLDALASCGSAAVVDVLMDLCSLRATLDNHTDVANSWREPQRIRGESTKATISGETLAYRFPPLSLTVLEVQHRK